MSAPSLLERLKQGATAEGFVLSGGTDFVPAGPRYREHLKQYEDWLAAGHHGGMSWMERGRARRVDPSLVLPGVKSVFCVAKPTLKAPYGSLDFRRGPRIARYAHGPDYHEVMSEAFDRAVRSALGGDAEKVKWKVCVDTSAVLERAWAEICGLGWIGKNAMLMHPVHGSWLLLGVVLLDCELGVGPSSHPNLCGNCERCLKACPTGALGAPEVPGVPGMIDSRECISAWTLEDRSPEALAGERGGRIGTWIAGCDLCQEACPFNQKAARGCEAVPGPTWDELRAETPEQYAMRVRGSALSRVKPGMAERNLKAAEENARRLNEAGSSGT